MATYKKILLLFFIAINVLGCLDEISYELPSQDLDELAIQGRLTFGDPSIIHVEVKRIFGYDSGSTFYRVDSVKLSNEQGQSMFVRPLQYFGKYESFIFSDDLNFQVVEGGSYKITVWAPGGRIYESSFETLYPLVPIDSIRTELIEEQSSSSDQVDAKDRLICYLNTPLIINGMPDRARVNWFLEQTYKLTDDPVGGNMPSKTCYITEDINQTAVEPVDGNILNKDYLADYKLYETEINYRFREGIYFNIYQQSLSEGAAEYFTQISKLTERNGNMFEGPVGELVTNFKNINDPEDKVYGYFYATTVDVYHVGIDPYEVYVPIPGVYCPPPLPPPPGGGCAVDICCDCLIAQRSTTTKPSYWQ